MSKTQKIVYWVATLWLSLGMVSTGIVQLIQPAEEVEKMSQLGYPAHFMTILGVWKLLGVVAILVPKMPLLKEWAYAGFFFNASGAIIAHVAGGSAPLELFGPALLLVLTIVSWYFRPAERKIAAV